MGVHVKVFMDIRISETIVDQRGCLRRRVVVVRVGSRLASVDGPVRR